MNTPICQVCLHSPAVHTHHRKMRSQGGTDESVNLMKVCSWCHNEIHANPTWAYEQGYLVHSWDEVRPLGSEPMQTTIEGKEVPWQEAHQHEEEAECPRCHGAGKIKRKPKNELEELPARPKATVSIRVPKDELENGAEVLTALFEALVEKYVEVGRLKTAKSGTYYALVDTLHDRLTDDLYWAALKGE